MLKNFKNKSLENLFYKGTTKGLQSKHISKINMILEILDSAQNPSDMNFPGSRFHPLKGNLTGHFSVDVSGNWRIIFKFENGDAYNVDYRNAH
jgi:proteic killer suppression protein